MKGVKGMAAVVFVIMALLISPAQAAVFEDDIAEAFSTYSDNQEGANAAVIGLIIAEIQANPAAASDITTEAVNAGVDADIAFFAANSALSVNAPVTGWIGDDPIQDGRYVYRNTGDSFDAVASGTEDIGTTIENTAGAGIDPTDSRGGAGAGSAAGGTANSIADVQAAAQSGTPIPVTDAQKKQDAGFQVDGGGTDDFVDDTLYTSTSSTEPEAEEADSDEDTSFSGTVSSPSS